MVSKFQEQLDQIEAQKQSLLEKQKQLEKEARYGETLKRLQDQISFINEHREKGNKSVRDLFDKLQKEEDIKGVFTLEGREIKESISSYYLNGIKEEDKVVGVIGIEYFLTSRFGRISSNDIVKGKVQLPYRIASQYRFYKFETAIQKIKDAIAEEERKKNSQNKLEKTKETLVNKFSNLYPDAEIKTGDRSIKTYNNSYIAVPIIKIVFKNTSEVVLRYFEGGSYLIIEKIDHRLRGLKGDDLITYLASQDINLAPQQGSRIFEYNKNVKNKGYDKVFKS